MADTLYIDKVGHLEARFQENFEDHNGMPISMLNSSFHFTPNLNVHRTDVFAIFQKENADGPVSPLSVGTFREIRQIVDEDDRSIGATTNDSFKR